MDDALTVAELRSAVTAFLAPDVSLAETRAIAEGRASRWGGARWSAASRDLGYGALLILDGEGGLGASARHGVVAVEAVGAVVDALPARSVLLAQALLRWWSPAGDTADRAALVESVLGGAVVAVIVEPMDATSRGSAVGGPVSVSGVADGVPDVVGSDRILLHDGDGRLIVVDTASVSVEPMRGIDPGRGHARVVLADAPGTVVGHRDATRPTLADMALVLRAAEQVGVAHGATRRAAAHARDREQFGTPIGARQAISHRLAADVVATEKASALVQAAARDLDSAAGERLSRSAPLAAAAAARASVAATRSLVQVLGGVGFTWEHDAQFWFRRALALAAAPATPDALDDLAVERGAVDLVASAGGAR